MIKKVIGILFFVSLLIHAQQGVTSAPFNVGEIIEKVSHHPVREGERIIIKDRAYDASFDESGVIVKGRETKVPAEDLVIPILGKPEVRDGKVVYPTSYGEIVFEGTSRGLRYEETGHSSVFTSPINKYTGNVARLCHSDPEVLSGEESPEMIRSTQHDRNDEIATLPSVARNDNNEGGGAFSTTGEFLIDTNVVYVAPPSSENASSVAFDGANYLIVWHDKRSGFRPQIYATRVNKAGLVLDPAGIAVSTEAYGQWFPAVGFGGTNYLVVWQDERNGSYDIYGARVSQSGMVLDPAGVAISTAPDSQWFPSIAFDDTNYLVVWADWRPGLYNSDIYGARVGQTGVVLDPTGIAISTAVQGQYYPALAFDGTNYLVVWQDHRNASEQDIYGSRVSQSGVVIDSTGIPISTVAQTQRTPSVAFDGANYLVVWCDARSGLGDIYGARINQSGVVLDSAGIAISTAPVYQGLTAIAFDGKNYLVVWEELRGSNYYDIYGTRVNQSGIPLDSAGIAISAEPDYQSHPSMVFDGTNFLVVWEDSRNIETVPDVIGARVSQSGTVIDPIGIPFSTAANYQYSPAVAFDGTNYLVVWQDYHSGSEYDIYGVRVNQSGTVIDPAGIAISTSSRWQSLPSVTFGGTNYLVTWEDQRSSIYYSDVYGARISQSGTVLDPDGIPISTARDYQGYPSVAFDGINYMVVWQDRRNGGNDIYGARVNQTGVVLDLDGIPVSVGAWHQMVPAVAFDGANYLVVWQYERTHQYYTDIYCARVSPSGLVLDSAGISISTAIDYQGNAAVAFDDTNFLVVWEDYRSGSEYDIYGARITQSGIVLDTAGIVISTAPNYQKDPSINFDSIDYLVVWDDLRNGFYADVYGVKISPSGTIVDSFTVSLQPGTQVLPALGYGQGNQILITYAGWTDSINHRPANTMRIWGKFLPPVGIEENAQRLTLNAQRFLEVYPNPFRRSLRIAFSVGRDVKEVSIGLSAKSIALEIFDVSGRVVKDFDLSSLVSRPSPVIAWNGDDDFGRPLPAGVYFCRLEGGDYSVTEKIVKLK